MTQEDRIVVGVGKDDERAPLHWAAREALSRRCGVELVSVYPHPQQLWPWETLDERRITADLRAVAEQRLETASKYLRSSCPELAVEGAVVCGLAGEVLTERSVGAVMTVVGSHGRHAIGSMVLGSVSAAVAGGVATAAVVVPPAGEPNAGRDVVVAIDGSERTDDVLALAFDYAQRHGYTVHAVYSWWDDYLSALRWLERRAPDRARQWLADLLTLWQERYPSVELHQTVTEQAPTAALTAATQGQHLLIVGGHRSHHPRLMTALGSVSQGVLHHAVVPVAVVHARVAESSGGRAGAAPGASSDNPGR